MPFYLKPVFFSICFLSWILFHTFFLPTIFPYIVIYYYYYKFLPILEYTNAFSSWDLENDHLSTQFVSMLISTLLLVLPCCRTEGKPCTPAACIEGGEKLCCRVYPSPNLHEHCVPGEDLQLCSFLCGSHWNWRGWCKLNAKWLY